jgi:hypothetical protein
MVQMELTRVIRDCGISRKREDSRGWRLLLETNDKMN